MEHGRGDRVVVGKPGDRHHSGAGPRCRPRRQDRGAGHLSGDNQNVPAGIFVVVGRCRPQDVPPKRRRINRALGSDCVQHGFGNTDIANRQRAAFRRCREQIMSRFGAEEGDGKLRRNDRSQARTRVAVHAARHVDSDHRHAGSLRPRCGGDRQLRRPTVDRPREAGAEQRVDNQIGAPDRAVLPHRSCRDASVDTGGRHPPFERSPGVSAQPYRLRRMQHRNRPTGLDQQSPNHESVAAVVAGAAQYRGGPGPPAQPDFPGHRRPGRFHQFDPGRSSLNRRAICGGHLRCREEAMGVPVVCCHSPRLQRRWAFRAMPQVPEPRAAARSRPAEKRLEWLGTISNSSTRKFQASRKRLEYSRRSHARRTHTRGRAGRIFGARHPGPARPVRPDLDSPAQRRPRPPASGGRPVDDLSLIATGLRHGLPARRSAGFAAALPPFAA